MSHTAVISNHVEAALCQNLCPVLCDHCRDTVRLHLHVRARGGLNVRFVERRRSWRFALVLQRVVHQRRLWKATNLVSRARRVRRSYALPAPAAAQLSSPPVTPAARPWDYPER